LLRNGSYGATAGAWEQEQQRHNGIFFYVGNVILTALTEFLRNLRNGNGETATAERQRNAGNQALVAKNGDWPNCPHRRL